MLSLLAGVIVGAVVIGLLLWKRPPFVWWVVAAVVIALFFPFRVVLLMIIIGIGLGKLLIWATVRGADLAGARIRTSSESPAPRGIVESRNDDDWS